MPNDYFAFKQFTVCQDKCAMKVGTDGVLLGAWTNVEGVRRVLDVGTGTGLVALMLAQRSKAVIDAVEIDQDAARQAMQNVKASRWSDRIKVYHMSFQEFDVQTSGYDLIVSNPPYYQSDFKAMGELRTTARHAVKLSYRDLIEHSGKLLAPEGKFSVIIPHDLSETFMAHAWFYRLYPLRMLKVRSTASKQPSRVILELSGEKIHSPDVSELIIMQDDSRSYTKDYKKLTAAFYL